MTELKKEEEASESDDELDVELVQQFRELYAVDRETPPISDDDRETLPISDDDRETLPISDVVQQFRELYAVDRETLPISDEPDKKDVIIELSAIQKMLFHVYEFGNFEDPIKKWKEVYGLLIGKVTENGLVILDAAPITHGTARGVEFKNKDYIFAAKINDMLINNHKDEFFVGWYHSHPAIGLFLSGVDLKNQLGYQMVNDVAVAIVFDHCLLIENTIPLA